MAPAGQLIILKNDTFILTDLTGSSRDLGHAYRNVDHVLLHPVSFLWLFAKESWPFEKSATTIWELREECKNRQPLCKSASLLQSDL
jgi:hypothetical protein